MQIRFATEQDQPAWDDYVQNHPDGLAYQLFAWQQAVSAAYGFKSKPVLAEQNGKVCGLIPLVDFRVPGYGSNLISLPYCDAGGMLGDSPEVVEQLLAFVGEEVAYKKCHFEIRSTGELPVAGPNLTDKVRMLLVLPGSSEKLLAGLKSKLRSQVKKPLRDGLIAKLGGRELVREFYPIFARNMRDLGSPVHSLRLIESVVISYGDNCRVGVVYTPDGIAAAAGIILLHHKTVSIPWASAVRKYNRLNPNMLLYWTFLSFAADNGYQQFDFGRSTPGEGTYKFKKQWGAEPKLLFWYQLTGSSKPSFSQTKNIGQNYKSSSKRELVRSLWQKLPLSVANTLGPQVRKYISL